MIEYAIYQDENSIGRVCVEREGLYLHINCLCKPLSDGIYRVIMTADGKDIDLGICVPEGESFRLTKKIPAKQLGSGPISFCLKSRREENGTEFVFIDTGSEFSYISRLEKARFERRSGKAGICLY